MVTLTLWSRPLIPPGRVLSSVSVLSCRPVLGEGTGPELSLAVGEWSLCKVLKH